MTLKKAVITVAIKTEIESQIRAFNQKYLAKKQCEYYAKIKGNVIYLMRNSEHGSGEKVCRVSYNGDLNNMDFAIYKYSSGQYDPDECFFPGWGLVDGTLEGAMLAGLKAYPV